MSPKERIGKAIAYCAEYCQLPPWDGDLQCLIGILSVFVVVVALSLIRGKQ